MPSIKDHDFLFFLSVFIKELLVNIDTLNSLSLDISSPTYENFHRTRQDLYS